MTASVSRQRIQDLQISMDMYATEDQRAERAEVYARAWRRRGERLRRVSRLILLLMAVAMLIALGSILTSGRAVSPSMDAIGQPSTPASTPVPDLRSRADVIAREEGVPPRLFAVQIHAESSWRVDALGAAGEIGLTQLMPSTAAMLGVDPFDPEQNMRGGARYLRAHYERFGDWSRALERYNGRGPRARAYAQRILRAWEAAE